MKKIRKERWIAAVLFIVGSLHLIIIHQTYRPDAYVKHVTHTADHASARNELIINTNTTTSPPARIVVLGERASGVDRVVQVLRESIRNANVSRHKHIHRDSLLNNDEIQRVMASQSDDILWVIVVRSPCEWAEAMIQLQRRVCIENAMFQNRGDSQSSCDEGVLRDSYHYEWKDWRDVERGEEIITADNKRDGARIAHSTIFDMRRMNLLITQQIIRYINPRHVKIVRTNEFVLNPKALVKDLNKEYNFETREGSYNTITPSVDDVAPSLCMSHTKWREAQSFIDWEIESYFGHHPLDCHLCHDESRDGNDAPSVIYLLGERNSGTTFVSETLAEAFDPPNTMGSKLERFSSGIPVLLHKHMFRHDLLNETELAEIKARTDILWVLVVRSPCDWAEGMFRKPYHLCPPKQPERCGPTSDPNVKIWMNQNNLIGVKLLNFITTFPWVDWAESVPFMRSISHIEGDDEVSISKPSLNYTYDNVFALRKHKLEIMKQVIAVTRNVKVVRLKEIERSPEKFIQDVSSEFSLPVREGYKPQIPSVVTHSTTCLTSEEWEAAQAGIDWELDGEFGFSPFDCRMCYGYNKSKRLYDRVMASNKVKKMLKESAQPEEKLTKKRAKALKTKTR